MSSPIKITPIPPKAFPGKLHRDNIDAIEWGRQNLLAYGAHSHVVIADPINLALIQTLSEHKANVSIVRWSKDVISSINNKTMLDVELESAAQSSSSSAVGGGFNLDQQSTSSSSSSSIPLPQQSPLPPIDNSKCLCRLLSVDVSGVIVVWNVLQGVAMNIMTDKHVVQDAMFHPFDSNIAITISSNHINLWNISTGLRLAHKEIGTGGDGVVSQFIKADPFDRSHVYLSCSNGSIYKVDLHDQMDIQSIDFKCRLQTKPYHVITTPPISSSSSFIPSSASSSSLSSLDQQQGISSMKDINQTNQIQSSSLSSSLSIPLLDIIQMVFSPVCNHIVYLVFARDIVVIDLSTNQVFGLLQLDRNKSNLQQIVLCRENPQLMFSLHDDGSINTWGRKIDQYNSHNYEQIGQVTDLSHHHKKSKKKGQQIFSICNHPFYFDQSLLTISGDGILWKWDFTSEILLNNLFAPRLSAIAPKPLNGLIKLGISGFLEMVSSPITSLSIYPFYNKSNIALIAIGTSHGTIQIINLTTMKIQKEIYVWNHPIMGIRWLSPGRVVCYSHEEESKNNIINMVWMVDFRSGRAKVIRKVSNVEPTPIRGLRLSFSRKFFVIMLRDRPFELWETKKFTCIRSFKPFNNVVASSWQPPLMDSETALSSDGTRYEAKEQFIFVNGDSTVKMCTIEGNSVTMCDIHLTGGLSLGGTVGVGLPGISSMHTSAFAWKRDLLVFGDLGGIIHVWSTERKKLATISTHKGSIRKIRFSPSPNSTELLVLFSSGEVGVWDIATNTRIISSLDLRAIDIEWINDMSPILVLADNSIRIVDSTLTSLNSRVYNWVDCYQHQNPASIINDGNLTSPLLLTPLCSIQLLNLMVNYKNTNGYTLSCPAAAAAMGQNQNNTNTDSMPNNIYSPPELRQSVTTTTILKEQLEKNNKLLSLVDDRYLCYLQTLSTAELNLSLSHYFGDTRTTKFWRLVIHSLDSGNNQYHSSRGGQCIYNNDIVQYYESLPLVPSIPGYTPQTSLGTDTPDNIHQVSTSIDQNNPLLSSTSLNNNNPTNQLTFSSLLSMPTPSTQTQQPSTPTKENSSTSLASSAASFLPFVSNLNASQQQQPLQPSSTPPPPAKKSIASFFGGLAQKVSGAAQSGTSTGNSPATTVTQNTNTTATTTTSTPTTNNIINTPTNSTTPSSTISLTGSNSQTPISTVTTPLNNQVNSANIITPQSPSSITTPPILNTLKQTFPLSLSNPNTTTVTTPANLIAHPTPQLPPIPTVSSQISIQQNQQINQSSLHIFDQSIMTMSNGSQGLSPPMDIRNHSTLSSTSPSNITSSTLQISGSSNNIRGAGNSVSSSTLPTYYDVLMDAPVYRSGELDKLDQSERKKPDPMLVDRLISKNILIGRSVKAVSLLLDITPDHPEFMTRAMKAGVVAASISQEFYQSTMKLVADNLIVANKLDDGIQMLCLGDKTLEACKYLQAANRWEDAAKLAKTSLGESECIVVMRAWACHLVQRSQQYQQIQQNNFNSMHRYHQQQQQYGHHGHGHSQPHNQYSHHTHEQELNYYFNHYIEDAISILLSIGDYYAVLQLLYEQQQYGLASHLIDVCLENNIFQLEQQLYQQQQQQQQHQGNDSTTPTTNQRNISISSLSSLSDSSSTIYLPITNSHSLTNDLPLKQLMVIIYKEYGNFLHQIHNSVAAEFYWEKTGRKIKY